MHKGFPGCHALVFAMSFLAQAAESPLATPANYQLGAGDKVAIYLRDLKEIEIKPVVVQMDGTIDVQHAGVIEVRGWNTARLAREIEARLKTIVRDPKVSIEVLEFGSQPVSVLGAVNKPGVHQLRGGKNLIEVLSLAEGMKPEAGNSIRITRPKASGALPLAQAKNDVTGEFMVAEVGIKALLEGKNPEANIRVLPHDVISVPRADLIYILGNVRKPGGFALAERESITILQAIAMAEGMQPASAPQLARILRKGDGSGPAVEVPVDVKAILASKAADQRLEPNDILYIPNSSSKSFGLKALDAGLQMTTGLVIFRR
jgi:polysaccharide biosynthesis/export protein